MKPLHIIHLATSDTAGGADRAAYRLHLGLQRLGHRSTMLVKRKHSADDLVTAFRPSSRLDRRLLRSFRRRFLKIQLGRYRREGALKRERFSDDRSVFGSELVYALPACDLVNLHWTAGFVDFRAVLPALARRCPVVWTLHDMNVFTGGCHYAWGCDSYTRQCGQCPHLSSSSKKDLSRTIWGRKRAAFNNVPEDRIHIVAVCRWLGGEAGRSSLLRDFPISMIHNGLDTESFAPRDQAACRANLGVPRDASVILFAAETTQAPRKGFPVLLEALNQIADTANLFLLTVGAGHPEVPSRVRHRHLGFVAEDGSLAEVYSAADFFVIPSLQEALAQTALEAMACGTPVIGFAIGGIPDMVIPEVTGYLVKTTNAAALAAAIEAALENRPRRSQMSANCRRMVTERYTIEAQAHAYEAVYRQLLEKAT